MAEHGLDEKVIGVSFDGTGYGDDGKIWGGEFLICDLGTYTRYTHFEYRPMPGGDRVTYEPWRMAVSYLYSIYGEDFLDFRLPFLRNVNEEKLRIVIQMMGDELNTPLTSSAGRLFDAVAALLNICTESKFHAEAPMRLENQIAPGIEDSYPFRVGSTIMFNDTFRTLLDDLRRGESAGNISAKFHNTIIRVVESVVEKIHQETGLRKVVLSGGTFQNRYLLERLEPGLKESGFDIYTQNMIPSNDGGIALGQLVVAAGRREA
jgi:hydrogenase maturation protein HypF